MVTTEQFSELVHEIYDAAVNPTTGPWWWKTSDPASMTAYNDYYGALDPSGAPLTAYRLLGRSLHADKTTSRLRGSSN